MSHVHSVSIFDFYAWMSFKVHFKSEVFCHLFASITNTMPVFVVENKMICSFWNRSKTDFYYLKTNSKFLNKKLSYDSKVVYKYWESCWIKTQPKILNYTLLVPLERPFSSYIYNKLPLLIFIVAAQLWNSPLPTEIVDKECPFSS